MKDNIRKFKTYAAWEYEKEEQDLNRYSQEGLQLVKGGLFSSRFVKDSDKRYLYQLDYNTGIHDMDRYIEIFADQGWEYVNSTGNGWHYFRKHYAEGMDTCETRIYTDASSLQEMENRWMRLLTIFGVFFSIAFLFYLVHGIVDQDLFAYADSALYGIFLLTFLSALLGMRRKRAGKEVRTLLPYQVVLGILLLLLLAIFILGIVGR